MKVLHVTTAGRPVTLRFDADRVAVHQVSPVRQLAVKTGAGGLLLGTGLAAVAVNAGDRGITGLDVVLWVAVGVALVAAVGGAAWWFLIDRQDRRRPAESIPASSVVDARSTVEPAGVTVFLQLAGGREQSFTAVGQAGSQLSAGFGRMLAADPSAG